MTFNYYQPRPVSNWCPTGKWLHTPCTDLKKPQLNIYETHSLTTSLKIKVVIWFAWERVDMICHLNGEYDLPYSANTAQLFIISSCELHYAVISAIPWFFLKQDVSSQRACHITNLPIKIMSLMNPLMELNFVFPSVRLLTITRYNLMRLFSMITN